jgi:hypothetical protein
MGISLKQSSVISHQFSVVQCFSSPIKPGGVQRFGLVNDGSRGPAGFGEQRTAHTYRCRAGPSVGGAATIAAAPFPIPIKLEGKFQMYRVGGPSEAPKRGFWSSLFSGCARQ